MNAQYSTDEGWADLRAAVPSFAHHWQSFMAVPSYDPGFPSVKSKNSPFTSSRRRIRLSTTTWLRP